WSSVDGESNRFWRRKECQPQRSQRAQRGNQNIPRRGRISRLLNSAPPHYCEEYSSLCPLCPRWLNSSFFWIPDEQKKSGNSIDCPGEPRLPQEPGGQRAHARPAGGRWAGGDRRSRLG